MPKSASFFDYFPLFLQFISTTFSTLCSNKNYCRIFEGQLSKI
jgi:hypothetical protein